MACPDMVWERPAATIASPLTSSLVPKTSLIHSASASSPPLRLPSSHRIAFHGTLATTKQQQQKKKKGSTARDWSYEHLMVVWDEVFERCCSDPAKASCIQEVSRRGLAEHGRGCVFVFESVQTKLRGRATGFTSKPPRTSLEVPEFTTISWYALYTPRYFLLDPRQAPTNSIKPHDATAIDVSSSIVSSNVSIECGEEQEEHVELINQEILIPSLRGMDVTRLLSLTANFDPEVSEFRSTSKASLINSRTVDAGGEDPYNPTKDELVLLLHLVVDGRLAVGADVLVAESELDANGLEIEGRCKLRLKYSL